MKKIVVLFVFCLLIVGSTSYAQLKVNSSGYVGINYSNPSYNLHMYGTGKIQSSEGGSLIFDGTGYGSHTTLHPDGNYCGNLGTSSKYYYDAYTYKVNGTLVSELSDENIKENIKNEENVLSKILQLRCVRYDLKKELYEDVPDEKIKANLEAEGKNQIGFLAQELKELYPKLVLYDSTSNRYSITYTRMVPLLVEAIKEQQEMIEELKEQMESYSTNEQSNLKSASDSDEEDNKASLDQNIPNPFSNETIINCYIPESSLSASIYVFDMQGTQKKQQTISGKGNQSIKISGNSLNPGMYLYTLVIDNEEVDTKRMILTN